MDDIKPIFTKPGWDSVKDWIGPGPINPYGVVEAD